ncbi:MAG: CPBP family intramembrane metalloprotease [Dehalococcoidales bacterium]|nr:CPBP family intramembrane metalloprotease [Dehalococcoidales bacterium]
MIHFLKEELDGFYQFLKRYRSEIIVVISATLFITLNNYHPIENTWLSAFVYYAVLPILVILIIMRKNPLDFGLRSGSPRIWGLYVLVICLVAAAVLYAASFIPSLRSYYLMDEFKLAGYILTSCLSLSASEFIYRGFLLFGLKEKFKEGSILLQMIPFALVHLAKPELETISTLFTGILFGYVAFRGKSYWPAFIIHLFINVFFVALVNFKFSS